MAQTYTVQDFFKQFPDDDACLEHLMSVRYGDSIECPKCGKTGKFSRIKKMPAYSCAWCGHHIHPMVGTPFAKSRTPLQKWFYAMYLFTTSRHGVPAKELQRQLGVTYKTAWRMGHEIRKYMGAVDGDGDFGGYGSHVELDETFVGGYRKRDKNAKTDTSRSNKTIVFGMIKRGGDVRTDIIERRARSAVEPLILEHLPEGTTISTDEAYCYKHINKRRYRHGAVNHEAEEWARGIHHTNSIEGFWSRIKNSIRGTHIHVSRKYLQNYLVEFEYRHNMRSQPQVMFNRLLQAF